MDFKSLDRYFLLNSIQEKFFDLDLLQQFLVDNDCINPTASFFYCQVYLYQQYQGRRRRKKKYLTESEFYLMIAQVTGTFDLFDPRLRITSNQNSRMCHPMTDYFISSSGKSISPPNARKWKGLFRDSFKKYHQLKQYRKLLEAGCRCVELEVWNIRDVRRIKTQHKCSFGTLISLSNVLREINSFVVEQQRSASSGDQLPIILSINYNSLRNSVKSQKELAFQLKSTFKERLYTEPVDVSQKGSFPSPEQLKNYVFVMAGKKNVFDKNDDDNDKDGEPDQVHLVVHTGKMVMKKPLSAETNNNIENLKTLKTLDPAPSLAKLINYFTIYFLKSDLNLQNLLQDTSFNETISADEGTLRKTISSSDDQSFHLSITTKSRMVHTYRNNGTVGEIYDPLPLWTAGVQLVALNWNLQQSKPKKYHLLDDGIPEALNEALFELGGSCGYLLKPPWLISSSSPKQITFLDITICSAILPTTTIAERWLSQKDEFVVEVKLYGSGTTHCTWPISRPYELSTRLLSVETGGNRHSDKLILTWNETLASAGPLTSHLTFVLFKLEKNGQLYGRKMIALKAMQRGFRSIRLTDVSTVKKPSSSSKKPAVLVVNVQCKSLEEVNSK